MLLTMTDATFVGIVASLFDVFGAVKEGVDDPSLRAGSSRRSSPSREGSLHDG